MNARYDITRFFMLVERHDLRALTAVVELQAGRVTPEQAIKSFLQRDSSDEVLHCFLSFLTETEETAVQVVDWVKHRIIAADEAVEFAELMRIDGERCRRALQGLFSQVA